MKRSDVASLTEIAHVLINKTLNFVLHPKAEGEQLKEAGVGLLTHEKLGR